MTSRAAIALLLVAACTVVERRVSASPKLYWIDAAGETNIIQRANIDGTAPETLVTGNITGARGLALDIPNGKMYWATRDSDRIQRANLDGSNIEDLVIGGLDSAYALVLDLKARKMYWSDYGT